ncbi:MAG: hypothetical protein KAI72_10095 [Candidatus Pacebacteria bacterium]|nr:hypothetical protein [Candidatus Paceibacterota bacterium]
MKTSTVQEKFNQAPLKIQDIVMSVETSEILYGIEKKYEVYKEEDGFRILPKETTKVLIGITHPKDFVPSLVEKLDIPRERAQEIAKEINQKIFSPVKDLLIEIHGLKKEGTKPRVPVSDIKENGTESVSKTTTPPVPTIPKKQDSSVPQIPNKQVENKNTKPSVPTPPPIPQATKTPVSTTPKNPPQSTTQTSLENKSVSEIPTPKKEEPVSDDSSQKLKNSFEEKLKQISVPSKGPVLKPPFKKEVGEEDPEKEAKKAAVVKDPYLETPD